MPEDRTDSPSATPASGTESHVLSGLSLRDYFAGQALSGMCSASNEPAHGLAMQRKMAETAYQLADAMIARREERSAR